VDNLLKPAPKGVTSSVQMLGGTPLLRLEWANYRVHRDNFLAVFYFLFWLAFAAAALWATYCIIFLKFERNDGDMPEWAGRIFFGIWLFGAWGVTIGIPFILLGITRFEWVEISNAEISFGQKGILPPKSVTIPLGNVRELFVGHCGDPGDRESFLTINIYSSRGRDRWGDWLAPQLKVQLFKFIEEFVARHGIPLKMRLGNDGLRAISRSA
jgi:hypothetical protein